MNDKMLRLVRIINEQMNVDDLLDIFEISPYNAVWNDGNMTTFCPIHHDQVFPTLSIDTHTNTFKCECPQCGGHRGGDLLDLYCMGTNTPLTKAIQFWAKRMQLPCEITDTSFK